MRAAPISGRRGAAMGLAVAAVSCGLLAGPAQASAPHPPAPVLRVPATSYLPGQQIRLSVLHCGVGYHPHWASSPAFVRPVLIVGKSDTGVATAVLAAHLKAGTYQVFASCDQGRASGQVRIQTLRQPASAPHPGSAPAVPLTPLRIAPPRVAPLPVAHIRPQRHLLPT